MALKSHICEILGIEYPILLAGMGGASIPALAAAVSNAGGLGVLGAAACSPDQLRSWIRQTRELTDKPFGVNLITMHPDLFDLIAVLIAGILAAAVLLLLPLLF